MTVDMLSPAATAPKTLPDELWLQVLGAIPVEDRTPVQLADWRTLSRQFSRLSDSDVMWRLFSVEGADRTVGLADAFRARRQDQTVLGNRYLCQLYALLGRGRASTSRPEFTRREDPDVVAAEVLLKPASYYADAPLAVKRNAALAVWVVARAPQMYRCLPSALASKPELWRPAFQGQGTVLGYAPRRLRDSAEAVLTAVRSDGYSLAFASQRLLAHTDWVDNLFAALLIDLPERAVEAYPALPKARRQSLDLFCRVALAAPGVARSRGRLQMLQDPDYDHDSSVFQNYEPAGTMWWQRFFRAHLSAADALTPGQPSEVLRRNQRPRFFAVLDVFFAEDVGAYFALSGEPVRYRSGVRRLPWQVELDLGLVEALLRAPEDDDWRGGYERQNFCLWLGAERQALLQMVPEAAAHVTTPAEAVSSPTPAPSRWRRFFP